jgi:hypothetical protein
MRPALAHSRLVAALGVGLLHLLVLVGLWQWQGRLDSAAPQRSTVRLLALAPTPKPPAAAQPRPPAAVAPRAVPGRSTAPREVPPETGAVQPATSAAATGTAALTAPAAPASAALNLALPKGSVAPSGLPGLAQLMRTDARANSPRPDLGERLFGGTGETRVIDLGNGGKKIIGPQGECTIITPNTWGAMNPGGGWPAKASDCSKLEPGARRHQRPP